MMHHSSRLLTAFSLGAFALLPSALPAQSIWTGGGLDDNFTTPDNWGGVAPSLGESLTFAGATRLTPNFDFPALSNMAELIFNSGAGAFVLGGNAITLQTSGATTPLIRNNSTSLQTIGFAGMAWANSGTIDALNGNLTLGLGGGAGVLSLDNNSVLTLQASAGKTLLVDSVISNGVGSTGEIIVGGAGTTILAKDNTNGAGAIGVTVGAGSTLQVGNGAGTGTYGSGALTNSGAVIFNRTAAQSITSAMTLNAGSSMLNQGSGTQSWSGGVTLAGNATIGGTGGNITVGTMGQTGGTFGFTKTGTNTLTLTSANTFGGVATISSGTVQIQNAASLGTGSVVLGDASTGTSNIALYLDTNRTAFVRPLLVSANGSGTVTLGSRATVTGSGANNSFTGIVLNRDVIFDSNALDRTDYNSISGTGNITVGGAGRSVFTNANTFVGNLTINAITDGNGLQLGTNSGAFNAIPDASNVTVNTGGKLSLSYTAGGTETINALNGTGTVRNNGGAANTLIVGSANGTGSFSGIIENGGGNISFSKIGTGTQTLSGANTYTGTTTVSGGTLALDYATQDNSKLANTGVLTFGAGNSTLSLNNGTHPEVVASTTLAAGAGASITRPSGAASLQLGVITRNAGATLNIGAVGVATTSSTNTNGILGGWATIGGTDWAVNSTNAANGPITAYATYTDITRLSSGTKAIADATASNVRIIDGTGTAVNPTLAAATTNINTLNHSATGAATTITMGTNTLRLGTSGGILGATGAAALTIGSAVNQGFLTAGGNATNTAGNIAVMNNSAVTINSPIVNNGSGAVSLVKTGSGVLSLAGYTGANYTGGTIINGGELRVVAPAATATYTTLGTAASTVTANAGTTLRFFAPSTTTTLTYANPLNLNNATLINEDGQHVLSGAVAITGANTINGIWAGKNLTLSGVVSGAGSLTKTGPADMTLSAANTFGGGFTLNSGAGKLNLNNARAVGTGNFTINGSAIDNTTTAALTLTANNTQSWNGDFTFTGTQGLNLGIGAVTLGGNRTVTTTANTLTVGGAISGAGFGLTKAGNGTLILNGNNLYTGPTTINAGRVNFGGSSVSSVVVNSGGTLGSTGSTTGGLTTNAGSSLSLNPTTPTAAFAAGAVNFAGATSVVFESTPSTLGVNSYSVVNYGSLSSSLANLSAPAGYRSSFTDDSANKKVLLNLTTGTRTWNAAASTTWNTLTTANFVEGDQLFASGDAVVFNDSTAATGAVTLAGTLLPGSVTVNNVATNYAFSGAGTISGTVGLTKSGTGSLTISNANAHTGANAITEGIVNIQNASALGATGTAVTTVSSGAALEIQGGITTVSRPLSLSGTGITATSGALRNVAGNNTHTGAISLPGAATIYAETGTTLTTNGSWSIANTLTKTGAGTLKLTNFTGSSAAAASDIVINDGTVEFATGYFNASPFGARTLVITVNQAGILRTSTAHALGGDNIDGGTSMGQIRVMGGTFQLDGTQYLSGGLVGTEGRIVLSGGTLNGSSDLRANTNAVISTLASADTSTISNALGISLQYANLGFDVAEGAAATDLLVSNVISSTNGITKTGSGLASFSGVNSYAGATTISAGTLEAANSAALGATTAGTTVASGATLQLKGTTVAIGAEALTLNGSGISSTGALRSVAGANSYGGAITLGSDSRINTDAGTLTVTGTVTTGTSQLTVGGSGNTTFTAAIGGGTGGLIKDGSGMVTLTGDHTYTGDTLINAGTLLVNGALASSNVLIAGGATLGGTGGNIAGVVTTASSSSVISPGSSPGTLTVASLNIASGATMKFELGTVSDVLAVTGNLTGGGTVIFNFSDSAGFAVSTPYSLITFGSQTGLDIAQFSTGTLPSGAELDGSYGTGGYQIDGTSISVQFAAVPEPTALLLGSLSLPCFLRRRRK